MKKSIVVLIILAILDGLLLFYLQKLETNKKTFEFLYNDYPVLVNTNNIELKNINDFDFNAFFKIYSFKDLSYKYDFSNEKINIQFNNNYYSLPYKIIEPETKTEIVYIEKEIIKDSVDEHDYEEYEYFYVDNDYLVFDIDEDLNYIREILSSNIHTTYETNIDYSQLNVSQDGQYSVFYITNSQKIEIIVEIR